MNIVEIKNNNTVEPLLTETSLPTSDLLSNDQVLYYGCYHDRQLVACVGLELYSHVALLRSLAVHPDFQNKGLGIDLVQFAEDFCKSNQISEIYLLTTTAEDFFLHHGFQHHERENTPSIIKETSQFSGICPSSSTLMRKIL